jgi:RHS repeat-associated protein
LVRSDERLIFIDRKGMQGKSQIFIKTGAVAYINEYYPFGLQNQQTSSTQYGSKEQRYKYNGKELMKDFGLESEDYGARLYSPQIGRWSLPDKMAEKYASFSPYNYVLGNPIRLIDPDGNDPGDVVVVFGGGDLFRNGDKGGAPQIVQAVKDQFINERGGSAESFSSDYWGSSLDDAESLNNATQAAYDYIKSNYNVDNGEQVTGGKLVIEGYSYGGVLANHLSERLKAENISVNLLVTVDAAAGPASKDVNRTVPSNVEKNLNIYQTEPSAIGSHGGANKAENSNKTKVANVDVTKYTNQHGKIDDHSQKTVVNKVLEELNKRKQ